jgi:hypothetical protein
MKETESEIESTGAWMHVLYKGRAKAHMFRDASIGHLPAIHHIVETAEATQNINLQRIMVSISLGN